MQGPVAVFFDTFDEHNANMTESSFITARQTGIGGSDIAVLFGVSPYKTRLQLYLEKRGELEPEPDNPLTRAGRAFETVIAHMVSERTGQRLRRINRTLRHPKHDFLIAHIDRDYVGLDRAIEIKNVSPRIAHRWGKDGAPDAVAEYYIPQPHHYMLVMDYPAFDVAAYFGGADLRIYPMERDHEMDELIIDTAHDFWHHNVLAGVAPEPDYEHESTLPLLRRIYSGTSGATRFAGDDILHWAKVAEEAQALRNQYDKIAEGAINHLLSYMEDAAILDLGDGRGFRRKQVARRGFTVEPTTYMDARFVKLKD